MTLLQAQWRQERSARLARRLTTAPWDTDLRRELADLERLAKGFGQRSTVVDALRAALDQAAPRRSAIITESLSRLEQESC